MDSKLFKNLSTFQQQSAYVTYQEKSLTRWNVLKQASEQFVQSIMLRRVDQILSDVWRSPIWSERKKKNRLERLSFREQSQFVSQVTILLDSGKDVFRKCSKIRSSAKLILLQKECVILIYGNPELLYFYIMLKKKVT